MVAVKGYDLSYPHSALNEIAHVIAFPAHHGSPLMVS